MSDSPVKIFERKDVVVGQPQANPAEPHDGATHVHEIVVHTDEVILDPNSDKAVQIPENSGASTVGSAPALSALSAGTAEEQFARAEGRADEEPQPEELVDDRSADREDEGSSEEENKQ